MTNKIKDRITKSIKKPAKTSTKKKSKIQPVDWYTKAAAKISIAGQSSAISPTKAK